VKFAILGPSCFGINLAHYLQSKGHEVFGIGRSARRPEWFSLGLKWEYHQYHITYETEAVIHLLRQKKPDFIINFAAQGESGYSFNSDNWRYYETNCMGLSRLVSHLESTFIQVGSSEVYGPTDQPALESQALNPTSPYSVSKAAFDLHLQSMRGRIVPFNIIRPSNCYCPGQQRHRIIPKAFIHLLNSDKLQLHGGGKAKKSFLHANDLSAAILKICQKGKRGEIYNVGPKSPTSIREVVQICTSYTGRAFDESVESVPGRFGEDAQYWLNSDKVSALGWKPTVELKEGIGTVYEWVRRWLPELSFGPTEFEMRP
jgi:dTDP-glucose 4,6-dehydratase